MWSLTWTPSLAQPRALGASGCGLEGEAEGALRGDCSLGSSSWDCLGSGV